MKNMRWGWILLGGFLTDVAIIAIAIPPGLALGQESLLYIIPPASFIVAFAFGQWCAKKAPQQRVLHGALVGIVAMLIYVGLSFGQPEPIAYIASQALKVLGGALGGFVASKRTTARTASDARSS